MFDPKTKKKLKFLKAFELYCPIDFSTDSYIWVVL
jgi:hypothetical protein